MLLALKSGAMRLRTFFRLINTPQTPYGQAAQVIMLVNLHRGRIGFVRTIVDSLYTAQSVSQSFPSLRTLIEQHPCT